MPVVEGKHMAYTKANVAKARKAKKAGKKVHIMPSDVGKMMKNG